MRVRRLLQFFAPDTRLSIINGKKKKRKNPINDKIQIKTRKN